MQNTSDNSTKPSTNQSKEEEKDHEGIGHAFFRSFDLSQPVGDIHQIHGEGIGQREVMMPLSDKDEASRLICGLTWGGEGAWTSWPPHQHEKDLEEVYCYFGMPLPHFGFHISYLKSGEVEDIVPTPFTPARWWRLPWAITRRSRAPARATPICGCLLRTVIPAAAITSLCWILHWKTSIPRADFEKKEHSYDEFI